MMVALPTSASRTLRECLWTAKALCYLPQEALDEELANDIQSTGLPALPGDLFDDALVAELAEDLKSLPKQPRFFSDSFTAKCTSIPINNLPILHNMNRD